MALPCQLFRPSIRDPALQSPISCDDDIKLRKFFADFYNGRSLQMVPGSDTLANLKVRAGIGGPPRPQTQPLPSSFRSRLSSKKHRPLTNTGRPLSLGME